MGSSLTEREGRAGDTGERASCAKEVGVWMEPEGDDPLVSDRENSHSG